MNILYSRVNYSRKPEFRRLISIYEEKGALLVKKSSVGTPSASLFDELTKNITLIKSVVGERLRFPEIKEAKESFIVFEYIPYPTLEKLIEDALFVRDFERINEYFKLYKKHLDLLTLKHSNYHSKAGDSIFGTGAVETVLLDDSFIYPACVDMNLDNLLLEADDKPLSLIDVEWVFDFPIRKDYVINRTVFYLANKLQPIISSMVSIQFPCYEINGTLVPQVWYDYFGLTIESLQRFIVFEYHFQCYVSSDFINPKLYELSATEFPLITSPKINRLEQAVSEHTALINADSDNEKLRARAIQAEDELSLQKQQNCIIDQQINAIKSRKLVRIYTKILGLIGKTLP